MSPTLRGAIYGLSAASIWGGMYVVSDVVLQTIPPFALVSIRLIISILVLGGLYLAADRQALPGRRVLVRILAVGFVGFGVSVGAQFVGTDHSTAVNGALITSASPAFILIFAALILHERITRTRILAVALATIGVLVIINPLTANFSSDTFFGDLMLALAAVTWGLYSVLIRQLSLVTRTSVITLLAPIGGLVLTLPAAALELNARPIGVITPAIVIGVLYLGIVSTAIAMSFWNRAFALVEASTASLFFFAQPLVGAVLAAALLGQALTINLLAGGLLIAVGVLVSLRPARRKREELAGAASPGRQLAMEVDPSD